MLKVKILSPLFVRSFQQNCYCAPVQCWCSSSWMQVLVGWL
jgi:hypothetical protein